MIATMFRDGAALDDIDVHPISFTDPRVQELRQPVDIALLSCNRRRITEASIRAIHERTTTPHRLLVLDNGSVDGSDDLIEQLYLDGLVDEFYLSPENNGVHWGHNFLLDLVQSDPYVCTDNDLVPCVPVDGKDWLSRLVDLMDRNPEYGAIACRPHVLIGEPGNRFDDSPEIRQMHHVGAHLRLMRTALVREVGGWERGVRPSRNHEERYICGRLKKAGYEVGYSRDVRCLHQFGDSDLGEDPHGYTAGTYHEGHREIWPPANHYGWKRMGMDWETCMPEEGK